MIRKFIKRTSKKVGLPPGTPVFVGEKRAEKASISYIDYNETRVEEKQVKDIEQCFPFKDTPNVIWINIDGIHEVEIIEKIGKHFEVHPLILEDILNTTQRPKLEDFGQYIFVILKMLFYDEKDKETKVEQVSLILGENFVISFQEREGDIFESIRERIRKGKGRIRRMGADYLAYALLDAVVDGYYIILENLGELIEYLEDRVISNPDLKLRKKFTN
jgi:magnesium transporter